MCGNHTPSSLIDFSFALLSHTQIEVISTPLDATGRNCFVGRETEQRWYSLMFGEGMSGGIGFQPVQFTLDAVDGFGRDIEVGGDAVNVTVTGPNLFAVTPVDNDDGTYTVEYAAEIGGYYDIDARLQNSQLDLAPERVYVSQASLCPVQDGKYIVIGYIIFDLNCH